MHRSPGGETETAHEGRQTETVRVEKPTNRKRKGAVQVTTGNLLSESGTGRPTALVREPYHAREN